MKVVPRLLILLLLGSTAVAEGARAEEPFLEWLLEQGHVLLAPPKGPALADKAREEFLDAALPVLKRLTENETPGLRGEALMTLAALRPDRSLTTILAGLESEEEELRRSAILAAGLSGHTGVLLPLERLVAEADKKPGQRAPGSRGHRSARTWPGLHHLARPAAAGP